MRRKLLTLVAFCFLTIGAAAQNINVELVDIEDNRGSGPFKRCNVKLKLSGSGLENAELIKFDVAFTAVDDLGTALSHEESMGFHAGEFEEIELKEGGLEKEIRLLNPPRKASQIKLLKGDIQVFNTSLDPPSRITRKGFTNKPNQSLLTTKDPAFDVLYIDAEAYRFMKQAEKEKLNKQIESLSLEDQRAAVDFITRFLESIDNTGDANSVLFYVKDLNTELMKFEFRDEAGEPIDPGMTINGGSYYSFKFRKPVTQEWQVTLLRMTPRSIITVPYELKDIVLP